MEHDLKSLGRRFRVRGEPVAVTPLTAGHIHDTYLLTAEDKERVARYVLQRINQTVFKDPVGVMANIRRVTEHIHTKLSQTDPHAAARQLVVIPTKEGEAYYRDDNGDFWRVYNFIDNAVTYDTLQAAGPAREAARMFGWFQEMLLDLPGPPLHETIPGFHNTPRRFEVFQEVLRADVANRAKDAQSEIDFVFAHAALCGVLAAQVASGAIPVRIAHNDAKINNVMLDAHTGQGVCVIDLDTVMPGLSVHDFGDLVRTAACPAAEDERDLAKVIVDLKLFEALARGFAAGAHRFLMPAERRHLVFGAKHITFEQLIRFLTDYLAGDVYYKVRRAGHNLDRSRTQRKLVQSMIEQEETLDKLVEKAFLSSAGHPL
jgi:hypothetical protein